MRALVSYDLVLSNLRSRPRRGLLVSCPDLPAPPRALGPYRAGRGVAGRGGSGHELEI